MHQRAEAPAAGAPGTHHVGGLVGDALGRRLDDFARGDNPHRGSRRTGPRLLPRLTPGVEGREPGGGVDPVRVLPQHLVLLQLPTATCRGRAWVGER